MAFYMPYESYIAAGAISHVYQIYPSSCIVLKTARSVACEIDEAKSSLAEEISWYQELDANPHPHRLQSFMSTIEGIFLPRMTSDLLQRVSKSDACPINMQTKFRWSMELASAVLSLEKLNLAHCDIKASNVLLDHQNSVKLADFDMMSRYGEVPTISHPDWVWYDACAGPKHDLFCVGGTLWLLFTGSEYEWGTPEEPSFIPSPEGFDCEDIILRCWKREYESAAQIRDTFEAKYLESKYGNFAAIAHWIPCRKILFGEPRAQNLSHREVEEAKAVIEKFLVERTVSSASLDIEKMLSKNEEIFQKYNGEYRFEKLTNMMKSQQEYAGGLV